MSLRGRDVLTCAEAPPSEDGPCSGAWTPSARSVEGTEEEAGRTQGPAHKKALPLFSQQQKHLDKELPRENELCHKFVADEATTGLGLFCGI